MQTLWHRQRKLCSGFSRILYGYAVKNNMLLRWMPVTFILRKPSPTSFHPSCFRTGGDPACEPPERWDSDHVVILNDELMAISQEIVRSGLMTGYTWDWTISMPPSIASVHTWWVSALHRRQRYRLCWSRPTSCGTLRNRTKGLNACLSG